jgi:hypothetical protein
MSARVPRPAASTSDSENESDCESGDGAVDSFLKTFKHEDKDKKDGADSSDESGGNTTTTAVMPPAAASAPTMTPGASASPTVVTEGGDEENAEGTQLQARAKISSQVRSVKNRAAQNAELSDAMHDAKYQSQRVTNTYFAHKFVSLRELANGDDVWQLSLPAGSDHVLRKEVEKSALLSNRSKAKYEGDPSRSVIETVKVQLVDNHIPLPVGVSIPTVEARVFDRVGTQFTFVMGAGEQSRPAEVVYSSDSVLRDPNMRRYGMMTEESVRSSYGLHIGGECYQVKADSPIIGAMVRVPKLKQILDDAEVYQDKRQKFRYVVLPRDVVDKVAERISEVLRDLPHVDMNKFSVKFLRADGRAWTDLEGVATLAGGPQEQQRVLDRKFHIGVKLAVTHVLTS